jgi:hypothetical protein
MPASTGGVRWETIDLTGVVQMGGLHATVLRALDQYVFPQIRGNRIAQLFAIGQPGPKGQAAVKFVSCSKILESVQRYLDYPKITGPEAIQAGIANGIAQGDFAYVASARVKTQSGAEALDVPNPGTIRCSGTVPSSDLDLSDLAFVLESGYARTFIQQGSATAPPATTVLPSTPAATPPAAQGSATQLTLPPQPQLAPPPVAGQPATTYDLRFKADKRGLTAIGQVMARLLANCDSAEVVVQIVARSAAGFKPDQIYRIEEPIKEKGITPQSSTGA